MTANTKKNVVSFFQTAFFVDVVGTSISNFKRSALFAGLFDLHFAFQKAVFFLLRIEESPKVPEDCQAQNC